MPSVHIMHDKRINKKYVKIVQSYRDENGKSRFKILENLGNLEDLEKENPNIIKELKEKYQQDREDKKKDKSNFFRQKAQELKNSDIVNISEPINYGYMVYEHIWNMFGLNKIINNIKGRYKFKYDFNKIASSFSMLRIINPDSKKGTFENKFNTLATKGIKLEEVYRSLEILADNKEEILEKLNKNISKYINRKLTACFYDVTTIYMESQRLDEYRRFGYSKDNKINQTQVVLGLLIDENGIPVYYDTFAGNTSEFSTLEPILRKLKEIYGIKDITIVADRGLNSKENLALIKSLGYEYLMAYKIKNQIGKIDDLLDLEEYDNISSGYYVREFNVSEIVKLKDKSKINLDSRLILTYSEKRANKDAKDRMRLEEKAARLELPSNFKQELKKGGKKYLKATISDILKDEEAIKRDKEVEGYYGIVTSNTRLSQLEIIEQYTKLWKIEESFRILKSSFEIRPVYLSVEESIKGHILMCYLALVLQRILEYYVKENGLEISNERIIECIKAASINIIKDNKEEYYLRVDPRNEFIKILEILGLKNINIAGKLKDIKIK